MASDQERPKAEDQRLLDPFSLQSKNLKTEAKVHDILSNLQSLDKARELFAELGYDPAHDVLSRSGWARAAADALAEDPQVIAYHDYFKIIYARLNADRLLLSDERLVVNRLLQEHPYLLCLFSDRQQQQWHFLNIKYDEDPKRRRLFRRITVGPDERLRTATERLSKLDLERIRPDLVGIYPFDIQQRHDEAFDVEAVTREFFQAYREIFEGVEKRIEEFDDPDSKRLFTQRLFNRLMFIAFVQKKGWLKFDLQTNYLSALWKAYGQDVSSKTNFYSDRLKLLFFTGLNTPNEVNIVDINRNGVLKKLIGDVPYLNGGLFEEDNDDRNPEIVVPDECIEAILNELFNRFNFTVTESTPLDIEVAVDPEMLGKVFEELVTGRHETGSYYTPKQVVSFMGQEALKGYLAMALPSESSAAIEQFVEEHDPAGLRNPEAVLEALRSVKACDPACGSGAYLLGMLHELLDLRTCLFATRNLDPISAYERKLEIIQNNVYGVDMDPFAVNIARLRLWLSLAVEFEGSNPPPLPNLDFKIEDGDSLTAPDPSAKMQGSFRQHQIEDYLHLKAAYMTAHGGEKLTLREQITALKGEISAWTHGESSVIGFDWPVEFAEAFTEGGFDIVLANPPYVRADAQFKHLKDEDERRAAITEWKDYRATLLKSGVYQTLYEKWDLYLPFLERAYQLLRRGGRMVFIISDAYNAAKYTRKSHEFFLGNARIERIDFCTDIPLFKAGISNTIVHFAKTTPDNNHQPIRVHRWGEKQEDFEQNAEVLPTNSQVEFSAALFKASGTQAVQASAGLLTLGQVCYISWGLRPCSDERYYRGVFRAKDVVTERRDACHPKPYIENRDTVKWWICRMHYLEWGTQRAPGMFARPTFPELYEVPEKLMAAQVCGDTPRTVYDNNQLIHNHSMCCLVPWHYLKGVRNKSIRKTVKYRDEVKHNEASPAVFREELEELSRQFALKYLLAVMNSTFAREWLATRRRSKIHVYPDDWKQLPIAPATSEEQAAIVALVDQILALYAKHGYPLPPQAQTRLQELERGIDKKVAALYSC